MSRRHVAGFLMLGAVVVLPLKAGDQPVTYISGDHTRRVAKGDVLVVPNGTPHQFTEVSPPFLYYTVKVTAQ